MVSEHDVPQPAEWIVRLAVANQAIGDLVAAMAQQIAVPGPEADRALATARAAYEAATGSPADDALLAAYHADADVMARRCRRPGKPPRTAVADYRIERCDDVRSGT